ncbi:MAG: hypothetical protein M0Q91_15210 [Methanoregula sp.]|nr:hypothetical protein [Methanoregula sp.]
MKSEKKVSVAIYVSDLDLVKAYFKKNFAKFYEQKGETPSLADAIRVCVEFANAHEVFS